MKTLKLEVGKTYRNRKGEEVKIIKNDNGYEWPYQGSNDKWYCESGKWSYYSEEHPKDLIEELPETRHAFDIPEGVKKVTVEQVGNRIVVEMVPRKIEPKPGGIMINDMGSVYVFKEVISKNEHKYYAWLGSCGVVAYNGIAIPGRPATPEEAQVLFDALKKEGKRWNPETMQVEDVPESDRIREWVETNIKEGYYNHEDVAEAIEGYLKQKEGEK